MPLTLEEFLAAEQTLVRLRAELATCDRRDRRRLTAEEHALVRLLINRWDAGLAGWMSAEDAKAVAAELNADAAARQIAARAEVRLDCLVFAGGRHGEQHLHLSSTSPVRARMHWPGYLLTCPPQQLDLLSRVFGWARGKMGAR